MAQHPTWPNTRTPSLSAVSLAALALALAYTQACLVLALALALALALTCHRLLSMLPSFAGHASMSGLSASERTTMSPAQIAEAERVRAAGLGARRLRPLPGSPMPSPEIALALALALACHEPTPALPHASPALPPPLA